MKRYHPIPRQLFDRPPDSAYDLSELMSEISEDYTAAGWLIGLEYGLWSVVCGDRGSWYTFPEGGDEYRLNRLRAIAAEIGGWCWWPDDPQPNPLSLPSGIAPDPGGPRHIALAEWTPIYERYVMERATP